MASLTPGVLSKLLQHAGSDVKVAGEHRTALLQVIGIVPSLAGEDTLQSRGFFLKVSDSLHSAYVTISDEDSDLIFSDKIQLGQFVYVDRLDSASPVPVLRGLKPVPRRRPCIGNPRDIVSSDLLLFRVNADLMKEKSSEKGVFPVKKKSDSKQKPKMKRLESDVKSSRRVSMGNCRMESVELRRLSLDSLRKSWERSPPGSKNRVVRSPSDAKWKETSTSSESALVLSDKKASSRSNSSLTHQSSSNSPLKIKNNHVSERMTCKSSKRDTKSSEEAVSPCNLVKVHLSPKSWDHSISWDALPSNLHDLGKDSLRHRNAAVLASVDALQEASAAESVIRSLSMFAELCESAKQDSPRLLVEQFLNLHQSMQKAATVTDAMLKTRYPETKTCASISPLPSPEVNKIFIEKKTAATSWIQAALKNDLSSFSLLSKQDNSWSLHHRQHHYYVSLETSPNPTETQLKNNSTPRKQTLKKRGVSTDLSTKRPSSSTGAGVREAKKVGIEKSDWSRGRGLKETASTAKMLVSVSREWFLKYLEGALDEGFGEREVDGGGEIAGLLGQIKRVNQWLEDSIGKGYEVDERVESLRKKLYKFLLEHVDSAALANREG
ncbi:uncharacterized protein LOC143845647 [Tasmannia lanceolata]|uniref:uncharacterized protein LOC143845647 n=1 Tax=Tasmannia lanceolata TaxID=3420 RepID=UPI0040644C2D